jgi:hypothetical protein
VQGHDEGLVELGAEDGAAEDELLQACDLRPPRQKHQHRALRLALTHHLPAAIIQGTFSSVQGTFSINQGTFGIIQRSFSIIQATFSVIQGTFSIRPSENIEQGFGGRGAYSVWRRGGGNWNRRGHILPGEGFDWVRGGHISSEEG